MPVPYTFQLSTSPIPLSQLDANFTYFTTAITVDGTNITVAGTTTTANAIVNANSSTAALRVTQVGAGNALLVEDSANPDATPFVVSSLGSVGIGTGSPQSILNIASDTQPTILYQTAAGGAANAFWRSNGTVAAPTIVLNNDTLGVLQFRGYDGSAYRPAAQITADVDGTPGTNDMPGRLVFSTTADGASSPTERMRIDNQGRVGIGSSSLTGYKLKVGATITGGVNAYGVAMDAAVQSDTTFSASYFTSVATTQATAFTLSNLRHYWTFQNAFGAGSSVTNQFGYFADASLTGATNNFGFYSNIASGTGRWNFYAAGTASNYFGGDTTISVNSTSDALRITQVGTGNALVVEDSANPDASPFVVRADGAVVRGHTASISGSLTPMLQAVGADSTSSSIGQYSFSAINSGPILELGLSANATIGSQTVVADGNGLGAIRFSGSDGTQFIRAAQIVAQVDGTPGTNDMPGRLVFSTTADGASSPTERMRIDNAGRVGIGGTPYSTVNLLNVKTFTGSTTLVAQSNEGIVQSDVTAQAINYASTLKTAAAAFTLASYRHYWAVQGTIGAGSAVTNQYGFFADSSLIGATNNYGFYSAIASGTGRWNFYAAGNAANYMAGPLYIGQNYYTTTGLAVNYNSGGASSSGIFVETTISAPTTTSYVGVATYFATAAAAFTLPVLTHYQAAQAPFGASSAITNQYGFRVESSLTGATNNYGFFSNIASGTGRWNFYAAGTADNYFAGNTGVGVSPSCRLDVSGTWTDGVGIARINATSGQYSGLTLQHTGTGTHTYLYADNVNSYTFIGSTTGRSLVFAANSGGTDGERMRIASTGTISLGAAPGAESLRVTPVASAVNYWNFNGNGATFTPFMLMNGSDTNISAVFATKGTGKFEFYTGATSGLTGTVPQFQIAHTASAVNYLQVTGAATGGGPNISAQGSDANINIGYIAKGTGGHFLTTGGGGGTIQFVVGHTASAVNYLLVAGSATGNATSISAAGSDTNIDLALTPKGTGNVKFGTHTSSSDVAISGYITIKDSAGNVRKLAVIT